MSFRDYLYFKLARNAHLYNKAWKMDFYGPTPADIEVMRFRASHHVCAVSSDVRVAEGRDYRTMLLRETRRVILAAKPARIVAAELAGGISLLTFYEATQRRLVGGFDFFLMFRRAQRALLTTATRAESPVPSLPEASITGDSVAGKEPN